MTFGEETPEHLGSFEQQVLPSATWLDPQSTQIVGLGLSAPQADPQAAAGAAAGALEAAVGGAGWNRRLAPRHQRAVEAFFGPSQPVPHKQ